MCTRTVEHVHTSVYTRIFHVEHCLTPIKRNGVSVGNLLDKIETQIYAVNVEQGFLRCGILSTFGGGAEEDRGCLAQLGILEFPKCLGTPLHAGETIRVQEKLEMRINSPARHVVSSTSTTYIREQWTYRSVLEYVDSNVRPRISHPFELFRQILN